MFLRALATIAPLFLASCGSVGLPVLDLKPYRMEIQQGNFVSQEAVSQLKLGMSKEQVRFVLGTPLLTDVFHADRWDYVYRRQKVNSSVIEQRKIAVYFEDGKLKRIEGDVTPASNAAGVTPPETQPQAQAAPAPGTAADSGGAASAASDPSKPAQTAIPEKPAAAPVPATDPQPQEKSWWQWLKEKF
jgi:outer membrane protein assembly factor BamE